ncbi:MAG: glycoside hydrolase family 3 protein [Oscillospiraceae bacterium]|nr:glycoside hydrolase family 3 protein [Oscillospiraceae bacterium]
MKKILDWNKYIEKSVEVISEGIVMLKNDNNALPLDKNAETAVFGRIQLHYYKSGTGSGGLVNVSRIVGITDGLIECGARINTELLDIYKKWDEENPFDLGSGWGNEPWSQKEMPIDDTLAERIARTSDTAVAVIGRTAGEEMDNTLTNGSYLLSDEEENMLRTLRKHFKKVVVLLNVGNIMDMSFVEKYSPDSVLYVWQGGMAGGTGTADVLIGKVSPSGKLPDTIAYSVSDYPSDKNFGDRERNFYCEDIYVGYRYFETFAPEKVLYPFGFGLSYTEFDITPLSYNRDGDNINISISVKNKGSFQGKEVIQLYCTAPQGKLGKPLKVLCGYTKTPLMMPGEEYTAEMTVSLSQLASYDDSGATGNKSCYVLEEGDYIISVGNNVRNTVKCAELTIDSTVIVKKCRQALAPVLPFERMKNEGGSIAYEPVPLMEYDEAARILEAIPQEIAFTGNKGIMLRDVRDGKNTMNEFIGQLSDTDLACIVRGEGMGSPKVTAGTASAFGGVTDSLSAFGIPCGCCSDGPSGMRLDCGTKAFSLPNGALIASTFNKELITELFALTGDEMTANNVECLLGPGMNIHRHPLNGRNFEYFSEDPYLTGTVAAAELEGLHSAGVTGTIKHFCGNNQETGRHVIDSAVSERALREIYLKGFEIAVREGKASSVMTTYGAVNGLWTAASYDLTTEILRNEWGFKGIAMTDWWANINRRGQSIDKTDLAAMVRAQNDIYMVCADSSDHDDNIISELESGGLTRAELQRCAANICSFIMNTHAMDRLCGECDSVEIINRPDSENCTDEKDVIFYKLKGEVTIDLSDVSAVKGTYHVFALDIADPGYHKVYITASSDSGELSQIPLTLFSMGTPCGTYTWNGTGGKPVTLSGELGFFSRFTTIRLYFAQSGLTLHNIRFVRSDRDTSDLVM